jgi:hypothetical protein
MLESLTADDFRPHLGDTYRLVPADGDAVEATLVEVTEHPSPPDATRTAFDIVFRAPATTTPEQGMFRVEREGADALDIFMVPVGRGSEDGMLYQAVFG